MNKQLTEIAFVLDRSGSMNAHIEAAISGFNSFLRDQQSAPELARLTLVLFDDRYEVPVASLPLPEVLELTTKTFVPRGSTALLDAIGRTIDDLGRRLEAMPETVRPGAVVVAILTDGLENASTQYSWKDVASRIKHQRETYGWQFLFLGADADAIAAASQINIEASQTARYVADGAGHRSSAKAASRKVMAVRKSVACSPMSPREMQDLGASMQDLVSEEDREERK